MSRALFAATLFFASVRAASAQELSVLHIKVTVADAERKATPVPRHALLLSDNPSTAPPRLIVTAADGTADVRLRPGNYTVESDKPVVFDGKAYQWTQMVDVAAGRDAVLELTAGNAEVESAVSGSASAAPLEADPSFLLTQWQDSVAALWTPNARSSGFLIDAKGLIATNQRGIGTATSVEVQWSPDVKVAASVLAADPARDVAVLWIDPKVAASMRPVPLGCAEAAKPLVAAKEEVFTIGAPLREQKGLTSGRVGRVEPHAIVSDLTLASGSAGGPVFTAGGAIVGLTSMVEGKDASRRADARVVPVADVCDIVASAEKKMKDAAPPDGTHLPVEPVRPFPMDVLKDAVQRRAGSLNPYQMSSSEFDVAFLTPVQAYGAQSRFTDFGNWSEYMADHPPVLLIHVTAKLVEGFWTTVARGAAQTQGVALPPIKHFKSGFSRMRVFCGDAAVTPIHPFMVEHHVSESDSIEEGLYVFDPGALGPHCASVKLVLYSEKEPAKGETRVVDPKVLQQIWQDFAPYREH